MLMTFIIINLYEQYLKVAFLVFVPAVAANEFAKNTINTYKSMGVLIYC